MPQEFPLDPPHPADVYHELDYAPEEDDRYQPEPQPEANQGRRLQWRPADTHENIQPGREGRRGGGEQRGGSKIVFLHALGSLGTNGNGTHITRKKGHTQGLVADRRQANVDRWGGQDQEEDRRGDRW